MATLSSNFTDAEVWAAYDDNASHEKDGSRAPASPATEMSIARHLAGTNRQRRPRS